jgi:osmotically-inducible protein OsmY
MKKNMAKFGLILALALSTQGCIFVAGAAAGAAGVAVVYDHRKLSKILADHNTDRAIETQIAAIPTSPDTSHISVNTFNKIVLLTGQTTDPTIRNKVDAIAKGTPDVARVYDMITIQQPTSALIRTKDTWITTKIKTHMLAEKGLKSGTIKVVTENGTVYLMGMVSQEQAELAVNIARQVIGVQRVIKVFQTQ